MTMDTSDIGIRDLQERANAAYEGGRLREAEALYQQLVQLRPDGDAFHFRLGIVHKYLREWPLSLRHNLRSLELSGEHDEGASWNAGIAATAIGDWAQARRQWQACGIDIEPGEGEIEENFGPIGLRLNPWLGGETVFALRIDPARARIANVPLPDSGHRYGDIVLHDGLQVGERHYLGHTVPVFNELERLVPSEFISFCVFVGADSDEAIEELQSLEIESVGMVEDWTRALRHECLRCSYGIPHRHHRHEAGNDADWNPDRTLGIAARTDAAVRGLLEAWIAQAPHSRRLDAIESREQPGSAPVDGRLWWRSPR
jgi:tetratricopeptide (TPR) repeat protein